MTQQSLFVPGSGNREDVQTRLLSRSNDPPTSRQAAKRTREKLSRQHETVLYWVKRYGPGTCREIAHRVKEHALALSTIDVSRIYHIIQRRIRALQLANCVRVQQDPSKPCQCQPGKMKPCTCQDVVRDGARVWETV